MTGSAWKPRLDPFASAATAKYLSVIWPLPDRSG